MVEGHSDPGRIGHGSKPDKITIEDQQQSGVSFDGLRITIDAGAANHIPSNPMYSIEAPECRDTEVSLPCSALANVSDPRGGQTPREVMTATTAARPDPAEIGDETEPSNGRRSSAYLLTEEELAAAIAQI